MSLGFVQLAELPPPPSSPRLASSAPRRLSSVGNRGPPSRVAAFARRSEGSESEESDEESEEDDREDEEEKEEREEREEEEEKRQGAEDRETQRRSVQEATAGIRELRQSLRDIEARLAERYNSEIGLLRQEIVRRRNAHTQAMAAKNAEIADLGARRVAETTALRANVQEANRRIYQLRDQEAQLQETIRALRVQQVDDEVAIRAGRDAIARLRERVAELEVEKSNQFLKSQGLSLAR